MKTDFISTSVAYGLKEDAFAHLSERDRKRLVRLMARISEKSYRRGVQHGALLTGGISKDKIAKWRFDASLDSSPWVGSPMIQKSTERLFMEAGVLRELGFRSLEE
jgi:hypothetical protein